VTGAGGGWGGCGAVVGAELAGTDDDDDDDDGGGGGVVGVTGRTGACINRILRFKLKLISSSNIP